MTSYPRCATPGGDQRFRAPSPRTVAVAVTGTRQPVPALPAAPWAPSFCGWLEGSDGFLTLPGVASCRSLRIDQEEKRVNGLGRIAAAAACAAAAVAVPNLAYAKTAPSCPLPTFGPGSSYHLAIHPSDFSADVTDRWFPLRPGTTYLYTGTKDGKKALDVFQVSPATKKIDGVATRVVNDRLFLDNALEETTGCSSITPWRSGPLITTPRTGAATYGTSVRTPPRWTGTGRSPTGPVRSTPA